MNFIPVITHAFAILLGWLVVAFASIPIRNGGTTDRAASAHRPSSFRSARSELRTNPSALLAAQANVSMDPGDRLLLKRRILMDWAMTDPDRLLRYLEDRPWLSEVQMPTGADATMGPFESTNAAVLAMETMAKTRPADLLAYAKREGCELAIGILFQHGDPRLVVDLMTSLQPGYFSNDVFDDILGELFERGCEIDLTFHHRLNTITDPGTRLTVFEHVAATLLVGKRHDELVAWVAHQKDPDTSAKLLDTLASQIVRTRSDVAILNGLPESMRAEAVRRTLRSLASGLPPTSPTEHQQRASLTTLLQSGLLDGNINLAGEVITASYFPPKPDRRARSTANAWKTWALDLPKNPKWNPLRRTAIRRWALEAPGEWSAIAELPTEDLRNAAYTAVVHTIDHEENGEHIPAILEKITDPALRNVAATVITTRIEDNPDHPVAIDPFRPLGLR